MKKKIGLFFGLLLGFCAIGSACVGFTSVVNANNSIVAYAEGEEGEEPPVTTPEEETFESKVVLSAVSHGKISVDKEQGHVGDIVTVTAHADLFYLVDYVAVNGTNLVESEETRGVFTFALVEGDNTISASFVVDKELLGTFSEMYEQASNKDWTNLFTVKNVVTIVNFILSSGILIAIVRYFVKDKRLAKKVEDKVEETVSKIVPETTKEVILKTTEETLAPIFSQISAYQEEIVRVVAVLVKCIALMQEGTPEAKTAILNELSNLNVGDNKVIDEAKAIIEQFAKEKLDYLNGLLGKLDNIAQKNKEVVDKVETIVENKEGATENVAEISDDGIQI